MRAVRVSPSRVALILLSLTGLVAAAWLWQAVAQRDAVLRDQNLSREAMVGRARSISRDFGLNTDGWSAVARLTRDRRPETRLLEANATSSGSPLLRPSVAVEVVLIAPSRGPGERVRAHLHLSQDGRLLDWNLEGQKDEDSGSDLPESAVAGLPAAPQPATPSALVLRAEDRLAGAETPRFHPLNADPVKADGAYELEAPDPTNGALSWRIHIGFKHGLMVKAELDPDIMDASFFSTFRWRFTSTDLRVVGFALFVLIAVGATLSGAHSWRRGSMDRRLLAVAFGLLIPASAGSWMWGLVHDDFIESVAREEVTGMVVKEALALAWCAWLLAAAEARSQRFATGSWAAVRMAFAGRLADGNVLRGVAAGLGVGAMLAVCRVAPEWLGAPEPFWRALGLGGLSASPLADAFASFGDPQVLAIPLFALTWAFRFRGAVSRSLMLLVPAVLLAMSQARSEVSPLLLMWAALAGGGLSVLAYSQAGALAVLVALPASRLWLAASGTANPVAMGSLAGVAFIALLAGLREPEPVSDTWLPVDESELPSTRRERLKAEFTDAREAQRRLLPAVPPALAGYDVAALCVPATDVSGDLYDFHSLPDGRTLFSVADVSGKGMPAALYMTLCKGILSAVCEQTSDVRTIASLSNRHVYSAGAHRRRERRVFVTAVLAALRPETGELELVRAGHNPPLLVRAGGEVSFLKPSGLAFGMADAGTFDPKLGVETVVLAPGDFVLLYSDGITEAMDRQEDQFSEERLIASLREPADAATLCARIVDAVNAFAAGAPQHDDMSLVVVRRTPVSG
jgi:serine phosphatase RsbU (regulator of sigma subunit)